MSASDAASGAAGGEGRDQTSGLRHIITRRTVQPEVEPQWPASLALLIALAMLLSLPRRIEVGGPRWIIPTIEAVLSVALMISWPDRLQNRERKWLRTVSILLIAILTFANLVSLFALVRYLLDGGDVDGGQLIRSAVAIWSTNVIAFGLWYWEFDGGGPHARRDPDRPIRDFLFPQMDRDNRRYAPSGWYPTFVDYLYVSFTNATAFSPTDAMPLSRWAKALMASQSIASLVTLAVIAGRAVNILK